MGARNLTDSLTSLEKLTTLNLDLHYIHNISRTLGPLRTLVLAGLPNLQDLAVPFHFFVRREHDDYYRAVNPASVLPSSLRRLRILACFSCLQFRMSQDLYGPLSKYQHQAAVLEFLEGLASLRSAWFPNLSHICYQWTKFLVKRSYCIFPQGPGIGTPSENSCPFHFHTESDISRLRAVTQALYQRGVTFEDRFDRFYCPEY